MSLPLRRSGFTLLELLIAMALSAVVSLTLVYSLQSAFQTRMVVEQSVDASRTAESVMEILRNDLQCTLPPRGIFATGFNGNPQATGSSNGTNGTPTGDDISFATTAPSPFHQEGANGEIKNIEITSYQPNGSTENVLVRRTINNLLNPQQEQADEEVLCRNVSAFTMLYLDPTTLTWLDTWISSQQNNALPLAVQVKLSLPTGRRLPDGTPDIAIYTRTFALPCTGPSNDNTASSGAGAGTGGTGSKTGSTGAAPKGGGK